MGEQAAENARTLDDLLAQRFHDLYERLAPEHGYETRPESAVPWADVPERNKSLMRAVIGVLRHQGYVTVPFPGPRCDCTGLNHVPACPYWPLAVAPRTPPAEATGDADA